MTIIIEVTEDDCIGAVVIRMINKMPLPRTQWEFENLVGRYVMVLSRVERSIDLDRFAIWIPTAKEYVQKFYRKN